MPESWNVLHLVYAVFCHTGLRSAENASCVQFSVGLRTLQARIPVVKEISRSGLLWMQTAVVDEVSNDEGGHGQRALSGFNEKVAPDCGERKVCPVVDIEIDKK